MNISLKFLGHFHSLIQWNATRIEKKTSLGCRNKMTITNGYTALPAGMLAAPIDKIRYTFVFRCHFKKVRFGRSALAKRGLVGFVWRTSSGAHKDTYKHTHSRCHQLTCTRCGCRRRNKFIYRCKSVRLTTTTNTKYLLLICVTRMIL